jgi:hypothetical protein
MATGWGSKPRKRRKHHGLNIITPEIPLLNIGSGEVSYMPLHLDNESEEIEQKHGELGTHAGTVVPDRANGGHFVGPHHDPALAADQMDGRATNVTKPTGK